MEADSDGAQIRWSCRSGCAVWSFTSPAGTWGWVRMCKIWARACVQDCNLADLYSDYVYLCLIYFPLMYFHGRGPCQEGSLCIVHCYPPRIGVCGIGAGIGTVDWKLVESIAEKFVHSKGRFFVVSWQAQWLTFPKAAGQLVKQLYRLSLEENCHPQMGLHLNIIKPKSSPM